MPQTDSSSPLKKQITYAGFYPRVFASMVDLLLSSLLLTPVFAIVSSLFYFNKPPALILQPIAQPVVEQLRHGDISFSTAVTTIFTDPRFLDYMLHEGGILKMSLDQCLELLILGVIVIMFWSYRGATPGKMLFSMKIVDATTFGKLSRKQEIIRFLSYTVSVLPFGLGFLWVAFDKRRQALHDKIAGTVVIKT